MGRKLDVDQLVDARHITARLGWPRPQLVHYVARTDASFPDPVWAASDGRGGLRLWYRPDVERWADRTAKRRIPAPSNRTRH